MVSSLAHFVSNMCVCVVVFPRVCDNTVYVCVDLICFIAAWLFG